VLTGPFRESVLACRQLIPNALDAEHGPVRISLLDPVPERGTEVEPVVKVLRLDEDVRIEQVGHYAIACMDLPNSWNVSTFEMPSIPSASR
jgi:hypothetical protein